MIQSTNSFVNLPFSAWTSAIRPPLASSTLAWRDQDADATWDPTVGDDGVEIVLLLYSDL